MKPEPKTRAVIIISYRHVIFSSNLFRRPRRALHVGGNRGDGGGGGGGGGVRPRDAAAYDDDDESSPAASRVAPERTTGPQSVCSVTRPRQYLSTGRRPHGRRATTRRGDRVASVGSLARSSPLSPPPPPSPSVRHRRFPRAFPPTFVSNFSRHFSAPRGLRRSGSACYAVVRAPTPKTVPGRYIALRPPRRFIWNSFRLRSFRLSSKKTRTGAGGVKKNTPKKSLNQKRRDHVRNCNRIH